MVGLKIYNKDDTARAESSHLLVDDILRQLKQTFYVMHFLGIFDVFVFFTMFCQSAVNIFACLVVWNWGMPFCATDYVPSL